jgi:hypothetical protein
MSPFGRTNRTTRLFLKCAEVIEFLGRWQQGPLYPSSTSPRAVIHCTAIACLAVLPGNKDALHLLGLFSCQIGGQINSNQCWALSFSIVNHPPFASSPNKVPITHFLFLRCDDNVREAAGRLLVDRSGCTSGRNRPLQREHNSQGIPAPHWQPSFFAHAHWGWFSHTQPMPKQTLQLGPSSSLTGLRLYASVAEFDSSSLRRWLVQLIACSVLGHHRFLARFFIVAHPVGT